MKILLDENFPLALYDRLRAAGHDVEHIIALGQRGLPDAVIRQRLVAEELVFLTQDTEFADLPANCRAIVIISRVSQSLPIRRRVDIWLGALDDFLQRPRAGELFDLLENGEVIAWKYGEGN